MDPSTHFLPIRLGPGGNYKSRYAHRGRRIRRGNGGTGGRGTSLTMDVMMVVVIYRKRGRERRREKETERKRRGLKVVEEREKAWGIMKGARWSFTELHSL